MSQQNRPLGWPGWLRAAERRCPDALPLAELIAATRPRVDQIDAAMRAQLDELVAARLADIAPDGAIARSRKDGLNDKQHPAAD
jgi:hypothetical protein